MPKRSSLFALILLAIAASATAPLPSVRGAEEWRISVKRAVEFTRETPMIAELSAGIPEGNYRLVEEGTTNSALAQVFLDGDKRRLGLVVPPGPTVRSLSLKELPPSEASTDVSVTLEEREGNVRIRIDGKTFGEHRVDVGAKPFLFPVTARSGASYTRSFPMADVAGEDRDHPHQRSFWFTHGRVNGVDFWSEQTGHGTIKEVERKTLISGPVLGRLRTRNHWLAADGHKVCEDERVLSVFRTREGRVLDFEIRLTATAGPVTFGDTKEGMFGVRVASTMDVDKKKGGKITNAEGLTDASAWGKASPWVDYTGPVDGKTVGIAILNHPRSFRFPTTWHVRTYGLFAANPFGWHDFGRKELGDHVVPEGQSIWFGYRVILHEGTTEEAEVQKAFDHYAVPIEVEVSGG